MRSARPIAPNLLDVIDILGSKGVTCNRFDFRPLCLSWCFVLGQLCAHSLLVLSHVCKPWLHFPSTVYLFDKHFVRSNTQPPVVVKTSIEDMRGLGRIFGALGVRNYGENSVCGNQLISVITGYEVVRGCGDKKLERYTLTHKF